MADLKVHYAIDGKKGYVGENGRLVVPHKYDYAYDFSEGLGVVKLNGKEGYINEKGETVIELKYDRASSFQYGVAVVGVGNRDYLIDHDEKILFEASFISSNFADDGYATFAYESGEGGLPNKFGLIDKTGKIVIDCKYEHIDCFELGLYSVFENGYEGLINVDKSLQIVDCDKYGRIEPFGNKGLFKVRIGKEYDINNKWGIIDSSGKEIVPCVYDKIGGGSDGLIIVEKDGKFGLMDYDGKIFIDVCYDSENELNKLLHIAHCFTWGCPNLEEYYKSDVYDTRDEDFLDENVENILKHMIKHRGETKDSIFTESVIKNGKKRLETFYNVKDKILSNNEIRCRENL